MAKYMIVREHIVKGLEKELSSDDLIEIPKDFVEAIEEYILNYIKQIEKTCANEHHEFFKKKDLKKYEKAISILEKWGRIRKWKQK